ncbi:MAG: BrnT family toxin [Phyllobacterium sp.]|uniref:BrnT family toxin n=1 Tax=Phyllobacterium sp. TaxID=1871046 RepID=UPI0030EFCC23
MHFEAPAKVDGEPRFLAIGILGHKHWSAVRVRRADKIRIVSVRRARRQEIEFCESE